MPTKPPTYQPARLTPTATHGDRPSARERGYTHEWEIVRLAHLREHPLCVHCEQQGLLTPATVVDHIIAHKGNHERFWDRSNFQSLCAICHGRKSVAEDGALGREPR